MESPARSGWSTPRPVHLDSRLQYEAFLDRRFYEKSLISSKYPLAKPLERLSDESLVTITSAASSAKDDITYHYLTFETDLPIPSEHPSSSRDGSGPPPQPDVSKLGDPFKWSYAKKSVHVWILTVATAFTAFAAGAYAPGADQMSIEWGVSRVAVLVGITIFTLGFAIAPMVLAPFSEINGRWPVFIVTGIIYLVLQICTAVTHSYAGMLVVRFIAGSASSTFSTMVGGVTADLYRTKDRNTPMAIFIGGVVWGLGLGPMIGSFVAHDMDWRWIWWIHSIIVAVIVAAMLLFFKETRGSVILSRRAKKLNKWIEQREQAGYYGFDMPVEGDEQKKERQRIRWKVKADEERASLLKMISISCYRPFHLLFTEPVVFFFSLWVSFAWSILFLCFAAIPYIFETTYDFDMVQIGGIFTSVMMGSIIMAVVSIYQEHWAVAKGKMNSEPEGRLYFACFESPLLPIGLFWIGWSAMYSSVHWIVPTIGIGVATCGIFSILLATFNFLADSYHIYASSAMAAQSLCRNLIGGSFPLFTEQTYMKLGIGGASSMLGGLGLVLTAVPWVLWLKGPKIRARSKIASELLKQQGKL